MYKRKVRKGLSTKLQILLLSLVLILSMTTSTYAADYSPGMPKITIEPGASNIPDYVIEDIINSNPDAKAITIHEWVDNSKQAQTLGSSENSSITPNIRIPMAHKLLSKTTTARNYVAKDDLVISVAKGETVYLKKEWTSTVNASVTGGGTISLLGLNASITAKYSVGHEFKGPPESSPYNSRDFKIKIYADKGTYTAYRYPVGLDQEPYREYYSGNWVNPTSWSSYSVDRRI